MGLKRCNTCFEDKPLTDYHRKGNAPDGRAYKCKSCTREYGQNWERANHARRKASSDAWYAANRERESARRKAKLRAERREVIEAYGGRCACCGEANMGFLTLDHVNDDGAEHRRSIGAGRSSLRVYRWAKANGYPDTLRVLCANCNCGRQWNGGVCPHKDEVWVSISGPGDGQG
jgi:hypothetical protein